MGGVTRPQEMDAGCTMNHDNGKVMLYICTMAVRFTCGYSLHTSSSERFRGTFQVFDHHGKVVDSGADSTDHATLQLAWSSVWSLGQMAVSRLS